MADTTPQNGTDTISTDDLATLNGTTVPVAQKVQRVKVGFGLDGDFTDAAKTTPLPIANYDAAGNALNAAGAGFLRVTDEPRQAFYDAFDAAPDTVNYWASTQGSSGVAAAVATGVLSLGTGTAANGYSKLTSLPTFKPVIPGWLIFSDAIAIPDGAAPTANAYRYWGSGTTPGTPTATAPVTDGYGFELNTDGKLRAVVYAGGVRTVIADLSSSGTSRQPLDANYHRWIIQVRTDRTFFFLDTIDSAGLVAATSFQAPQVQTLPKLFLAVGGATPPVSNTQILCTGAVVSDSGKNATQIADGALPWRRASVSAAGALTVGGAGTTQPNGYDPALPTRQVPSDSFRCSFAEVGSGVQTPLFSLLQTGGGQAVNQSAGSLVVTSGTTANAETLIRSVRTFSGAFELRSRVTLSQRIANNNFSVELADLIGAGLAFTINSTTSVTVTHVGTNPFSAANVGQSVNLSVIAGAAGIPGRFAIASVSGLTTTFTVAAWPASGSGTLTLWGWNYFRTLYTGVTATNANFDAQRKGWASGDTIATINTTASPGHMGVVQGNANFIGFSDALVASNAGYATTPRATRVENIPDDDTALYIFVRILNGTTAPASTTTFTLGFVACELTSYHKVYLAGADQNGAPFATAVNVVSGTLPTVTTVGTVTTVSTVSSVTAVAASTPVTPTTTFLNSAATTNATSAKASAGTVWSVFLSNMTASAKFVKLYNKASAPTVGTDIPVMTIEVAPNASRQVDGGSNGFRFATGIAFAITGAQADADATAVALGDVHLALSFT
jgi:hypothetical protein